MGVIDFCLKKPILVAVAVFFVLMAGIWALISIPIQLTPDVSLPTLRVRTIWPGASPYEVEREIVREQERYLNNLPGLVRLTSEAQPNQANITLEFKIGTDIDDALLRVSNQLNQVSDYPENALRPAIIASGANSRAIIWMNILAREDNPRRIQEYKRFIDDFVKPEFEKIPGVAETRVYGGDEPEMQVRFDSQKLSLYGISIRELIAKIRAENVDVSGGRLTEGKREYTVRTLSRFRTPEDFGNMIIKYTPAGAVHLSDVAEVAEGFKIGRVKVLHNEGHSIVMPLYKEAGANVLDISQKVTATIDRLNRTILAKEGLVINKLTDPEYYINSAIGLVLQNLIVGGSMALIVLFLFLGNLRSSLVVALSIPVSIIGTLVVLEILGRNINVISLAGLAFAVGMVVDSAIVVLENIDRWRSRGSGLMESALHATKEVYGAILASALTTVAVFLPVVFVEDEAGQLFEDIAIAICVAIILSLVVSTTVIPPFYRYFFMKAGQNGDEPLGVNVITTRLQDFCIRWLVTPLMTTLSWIQSRLWRKLMVVLGTTALAVGVAWALTPKMEYLPKGNRNLILSFLFPPPGYSPDETERMGQQLMDLLEPHFQGEVDGAPQFDRAFFIGFGTILILGGATKDPTRVGEMIAPLNKVLSQIPGMRFFTTQTSLFASALGAGRSIDVEIYGDDINQVAEIAGRLFLKARGLIPGAQVQPIPSFELGIPEIQIIPLPDRAARAGLTTADLGLIVDIYTDGRKIDEFLLPNGDTIDLTLMSNSSHLLTVKDFESQSLLAPNGTSVTLGAMAEIRETVGLNQINHIGQNRAFILRVKPPDSVPLETALEIVQEQLVAPAMEEYGHIPGFEIALSGQADAFTRTRQSLQTGFILAMAITFLLLVILFEDVLAPFVIMGALPVAAAGGLIGLWLVNTFLTSQPLDMLTLLGFLMLIGIVVNNPILIVSKALTFIRVDKLPLNEAVARAVRLRIRPVFMTTFTSVFGLLPLVLFPGAGSELYRGLGSAVLGGLVLSTFVSIVFVPTLFSLLQDLQGLFRETEEEEDLLPSLARSS